MHSPAKATPPRTAVFTIVSKNYLHYARVLMQSLATVSPSWDRVVLIADRMDTTLDPQPENFRMVAVEDLPIPDRARFTFRYTILEFNTAVKPWFFRRLFEEGYDHVVYLDPDIYVYAALEDVDRALSSGTLAVLVPHLTGRLLDVARPSEQDILQAGAYNLGFCALGRHPSLEALLDFWCEKSLRDFVVDLTRGLFTDQRWMDLVPGMFADVQILRHEGYDVAYWNMAHRRLLADQGRMLVNGQPLIFFHFSGIDPVNPAALSRHQNRYDLATAGVVAGLVTDYCARLHDAGFSVCSNQHYAFGSLADGSPIPDMFRKLYRSTPEVEEWVGDDPYALSAADWNRSVDDRWPPLSRAMLAVYQARPDIRRVWPDVLDADRAAFADWFVENSEQVVPACYVETIRAVIGSRPTPASDLRPSRQLPGLSFEPQLIGDAMRKAAVAFRERRLPMSPTRWLQLYKLHTIEHAQKTEASSPQLPAIPWPAHDPGLTIVGYTSDGTGLSAAAQSSRSACVAGGISTELLDARPVRATRGRHRHTLLHVNADQMPIVAAMLGPEFFRDRYTIGSWAWELPEFPDAYLNAFEWVDEVWAGSRFIQGSVAAKSPVPVVHMPYAVQVAPTENLGREQFRLPRDRFLFLTMYDALSVQDRKNPLGAIEAFRTAFGSSPAVGLVVRVNNASSRPDDVARVRQRVADTAGTYLIDRPMSRPDAQALQASCDAFVSLHRSEGFGLNIAEAMLLEKPVIVTAWSGNMDFTTHRNACLVDYGMTRLTETVGPYQAGNEWAEPDVEHAAEWMTRLVGDSPFRGAIGRKGRATIAAAFSVETVGEMYRRRIALTGRRRSAGTGPGRAL